MQKTRVVLQKDCVVYLHFQYCPTTPPLLSLRSQETNLYIKNILFVTIRIPYFNVLLNPETNTFELFFISQ